MGLLQRCTQFYARPCKLQLAVTNAPKLIYFTSKLSSASLNTSIKSFPFLPIITSIIQHCKRLVKRGPLLPLLHYYSNGQLRAFSMCINGAHGKMNQYGKHLFSGHYHHADPTICCVSMTLFFVLYWMNHFHTFLLYAMSNCYSIFSLCTNVKNKTKAYPATSKHWDTSIWNFLMLHITCVTQIKGVVLSMPT